MKVIDLLDEEFAFDAWKMKLATTTKIGETAKLAPERKKQVDSLLSLIDAAVAASRLDVAAESRWPQVRWPAASRMATCVNG